MQKAEIILAKLHHKSKEDKTFKFRRLYRNLFNPDFYLNAYSKIYWKPGNMTKGTTPETIDGFNYKRIERIIKELKYERYYPSPTRRKLINKKNSNKKRPLGIPTFRDKILQEVIRQILETIYEPVFSKNSHGFRPNRSCHTALYQLKRCNGTNWIIEGDITGFFDNIDHDILISILKQKIDDGRLLELIKRFLKSGVMEDGIRRNTVNGTPQGGIVSPLLANIYLNELDKYMDKIMSKNNKGKGRKRSKEYHRIDTLYRYYRLKGEYEKAKSHLTEKRKIPSKDMFDPNYQLVRYIRYADDFVVCINGSKQLAKNIKASITAFLNETVKLELNNQKTLITNATKSKVRFLGYDIIKAKDNTRLTKVNGNSRRSVNGVLQLLVPNTIISDKIKKFTKKGKPIHVNNRINLPILNQIKIYNSEIRGLYNYYSLATNVSTQLYRFKYYHYWSLLRTIAAKEKSKVSKVIKKYGINVRRKLGTGTIKVVGITYKTREGYKTLMYFNDSIKRNEYPITWNVTPYEHPNPTYNEVLNRLSMGKCELCGIIGNPHDVEVHHVRKLDDLDLKYKNQNTPNWVKVMKKMRRKTLIVCKECHININD